MDKPGCPSGQSVDGVGVGFSPRERSSVGRVGVVCAPGERFAGVERDAETEGGKGAGVTRK